MKTTAFITAAVTVSVVLVIVFFVTPEIVYSNFHIIAGLLIAACFFTSIVLSIGMRMKTRFDNNFRVFLDGLNLTYTSFYNIVYAYGIYKGLHVSFKYGRIMKGDLAPDMPGLSRVAILCRFKIPGTEQLKIHLAVFAEKRSHAVRKALGWDNPETGFYVSKKTLREGEDVLNQYRRLSSDTRDRLRSIAARADSLAISPDWESVMIGRKNSLQLVGGDEAFLSLLDFQVKMSPGLSPGERDSFLDEVVDAVAMVSHDLG